MHLPHSASLKDQFDRMALSDCGGHKCVPARAIVYSSAIYDWFVVYDFIAVE